jgi:competence protein ComEA
MRKSHSIFILAILIATVCVNAFAADAATGVVNINTADVAQLSLLPRVGAAAAQRIVDYRKQNGSFHKLTDLMQVKGFGDKTFERVRSYITLEGSTTLTAKVQGPRKARAKSAAKQPSSTASK